MLTETLLYLLTPCPTWARKAGYLGESIAIGARHRRQSQAWSEHLSQSRSAILKAAAQCARKRRVTVLGSGHGFDLPLEELSATFAQVDLVDVLHPLSVRLKARGHKRVTLIEADVTGIHGPRPAYPADTDLVISLNLISQLGIAPHADAENRRNMRQRHLAELFTLNKSTGCTLCVIGDTERIEMPKGKKGDTTDAKRSIIDWPLPIDAGDPVSDENWTWPVAPLGEVDRRLEIVTAVRAGIWA